MKTKKNFFIGLGVLALISIISINVKLKPDTNNVGILKVSLERAAVAQAEDPAALPGRAYYYGGLLLCKCAEPEKTCVCVIN